MLKTLCILLFQEKMCCVYDTNEQKRFEICHQTLGLCRTVSLMLINGKNMNIECKPYMIFFVCVLKT